jgi:hypothetical protein
MQVFQSIYFCELAFSFAEAIISSVPDLPGKKEIWQSNYLYPSE